MDLSQDRLRNKRDLLAASEQLNRGKNQMIVSERHAELWRRNFLEDRPQGRDANIIMWIH
jgi:hypothetical protein